MRRLAAIAAVLFAGAVWILASGSSAGAPVSYQVRAIFDNAGFAVPGEDVRIAGAPIGSISSLDVTKGKQAAVTLQITDSRFTPFYANATCSIRPQSLIGERYVDCNPGSSSAPALNRIASGPGAGTYYLPITRTSSPIDSDIVQGIYREPIRQRFALIIDELGTGLDARGSDLNAVIHRANPALGYTDQVIKILAAQNRQLAQLATDSDTVLTPLARVKREISGFVVGANQTAVASAARSADTTASIRLLPSFLRQLRPLLADLGQLADQGTPLMASLAQGSAALGRQFENLTPFAKAARPALIELGKTSQQSQPALLGTIPLAKTLQRFGQQAVPASTLLERLLSSLDRTGGIQALMSVLFYGTSAANGFDSIGHYVRVEPLVGSCTFYAKKPVPGCSANFSGAAKSAGVASAASATSPKVMAAARSSVPGKPVRTGSTLKGLLDYLIGARP